MAFHKTDLYPEDLRQVAFYAKSLAHPERVRILQNLRADGPLHVIELHKSSPLAFPTLSQHLGILRRADLVDFDVRDPYIHYSLSETACREALSVILRLLDELNMGLLDKSA